MGVVALVTRLPQPSDPLERYEPFGVVRLVAVDIDGTLSLDRSVGDVLASLRGGLAHHRIKVRMTIATGRTFGGAHPVIRALGISSRTPVILYNGAVVTDARGRAILRRKDIPMSAVQAICSIVSERGLSCLLYSCQSELELDGQRSQDPRLVETVAGIGAHGGAAHEFNGLEVVWQAEPWSFPIAVAAILVPLPAGADGAEVSAAVAGLSGVRVTRSSPYYLEICSADTDKARALAFVARRLGIEPYEVLAIGDNDNDVAMLSWAGLGVAVANASEAARDASDFICGHDADAGVTELFRIIQDARRYRTRTRS